MKNHGMVRRFTISYLFLAVMVFICLMPLFFHVYGILRRQSVEIEQYKMTFLKTEIDRYFSEAQNATYSLSSAYSQRLFLNNSIADTDYYTARDIANTINNLKLQNKTISNIALYYRDVDIVCSISGFLSSKQFFDTEYSRLICSYDEWIAKICSREEFLVLDSINDSGGKSNTLFYCFDLSAKGIKNRNVIVFAEMNIDNLKNDVLNKYHENNVVLLNNANSYKMHLSDDSFEVVNIHGSVEKSGEYVFIKTDSINKSWSYVVRIDKTQYMQELQTVWILTTLIFIIVVVSVLFYSMVLSKRHYSPIKKLVTKISDYDTKSVKCDNEIDYIDGYLDYLNQSINQLEENDKVISEMIYHKIAEKIILGKADANEWEIFMKYKPDFTGRYFTVARIKLESKNGEQLNNSDFNNIIESIITEYINKTFVDGEYRGIVTQNGNEVMCLVNTKNYLDSDSNRYYFSMLENALNQYLNVGCVIAVSECCEKIEHISDINAEVDELFRYMMLVGISGVFLNENLQKLSSSDSALGINFAIIQNILKCGGNAVEAYEEFVLMLDKDIDKRKTANEVEWLLLSVKVMFARLVDEIVPDKSLSSEFLIDLAAIRTCAELKDAAKQLFDDLYIFLTDAKGKLIDNGIENKVKAFINDNYSDVNLTIKVIAEHFDFHFVYLSHLFREKTGIGISDYITSVRISKAKEMLAYTDDTIEAIVLKVGYISLRTFGRNFKKLEGVTPGAYRASIDKKRRE